jgi:hypothetical protein
MRIILKLIFRESAWGELDYTKMALRTNSERSIFMVVNIDSSKVISFLDNWGFLATGLNYQKLSSFVQFFFILDDEQHCKSLL